VSNQGRRLHENVKVRPEVIEDWRWQLQIRAWTYDDWREAAGGLAMNTLTMVMAGRSTSAKTVAALARAFAEHPPIPGLAEILRAEVEVSA